MLNMTAVKTIRMSLDKRNVKYIIEKAECVFLWDDLDTFNWLINDMVNNAHAEKITIFCQSVKSVW